MKENLLQESGSVSAHSNGIAIISALRQQHGKPSCVDEHKTTPGFN